MHLINHSNNIEVFTDENITLSRGMGGKGRGYQLMCQCGRPAAAAKVSQGWQLPYCPSLPHGSDGRAHCAHAHKAALRCSLLSTKHKLRKMAGTSFISYFDYFFCFQYIFKHYFEA